MQKGLTKYKVTVTRKVNSFPGNEIKSFEIVEKSDKVLTEPYLKEQAEKKGLRGWSVIAYLPVFIVEGDLEIEAETE